MLSAPLNNISFLLSISLDDTDNKIPACLTYIDPNNPANVCPSDQTIVKLLTDHFVPSSEFKFPVTD